MEHSEDDFECWLLFDRMFVDGNPAAIINDPNAAIGEECDQDARRVACERFVDGIVHDLIHEMVKAPLTCRTDVHARTLTDGVKAF